MFAVAFEGSVGVWSTARAEEICTFSSRNIGRAKEVMFAGEEGTELVLVGQEGTVCWDLLTLEGKPTLLVNLELALNSGRFNFTETFSSSVAYSTVTPAASTSSSTLLAAENSVSRSNTTHSKARRRSNWMVGSKSSEHPLIRFLPSSSSGVQCFSRLRHSPRHRKRNSVSLEWKSRRTRQKRQWTREMLRKSNTAISRQLR